MNYTKYLRWTLVGGLFLSLIIPFIVANGTLFPGFFLPNMFFPFITGKNFVFRILVELLFGVYLVLALREPKYRPRFSWTLAAVVAFAAWAGVATLLSVDPTKSFWGNFERMEGYITVLHLLAYFIMASAVLSAEKLWTWFLRISVALSAVMSGYGILQLMNKIAIDQGGVRLDGTLGNAAYFAVYMLFNIFFALILLYRDWGNKTLRWLYAVVIALDTFTLFYSETRGTVLGLIAGLVVAGLYIAYAARAVPHLKRLRQVSIGALIALAVLGAAFIAVRNVPAIQNAPAFGRLASISLTDTTTQSRFMIWHMALQGFKEKPITGWGQENFNFVFNKYYNAAMYDQEQWFDRAHDAFLDWLTAAGLPGFLLFISMFAAAAYVFWRSRELSVPERAVLLGLVAGYAFHELFVFDNIVSYLQFFTVLALAHALSQREVPRTVWLARPLGSNGIAVAAPIIAIVVIGGAWWLNAPGIANATGLLRAITPTNTATGATDLDQNLAAFKTVLADGPLGRQEATEQLLQFAYSVAQAQSATPEQKQAFSSAAYSAITEMTKERKGDARLELFFGAFLDQFGQYPEALQHLTLAHQESPDKQQIYYEIGMNNLLRSGDTKGAVGALQTAFNLDQEDDQARVYYAAALYYDGQNAQADALLTERFGSTTPDNDMLVQVYYDTKQYPRAAAILTNRIAQTPSNTQAWLQLAAVEYGAGDKADAITTLQKAEQVNPSLAAQADQLIAQLKAGK